jgi:hypothetical protein
MSIVKVSDEGKLVQNKPLIYSKMAQVMSEIGSIGKNSTNTAQGFKFRGIDSLLNSLYPALVKHGVFMAPRVLGRKEEIREVTRSNGKTGIDKHVQIDMSYTFYAEDGSSVTVAIPAEGLDSGDKATNKALSAALKYALIQTFSIPTEDMEEGDLTTPEMGAPKKAAAVGVTGDVDGKGTSVAPSQQASVTNTEATEAPKSGFRKPTTKTETKPAAKSNGAKAVDDSNW